MKKVLKNSDVEKLNKLFDRLIHLKRARKILSDEGPVTVTVRDCYGGSSSFATGSDKNTRREFFEIIDRLIFEDKLYIKNKYGIEIKQEQ